LVSLPARFHGLTHQGQGKWSTGKHLEFAAALLDFAPPNLEQARDIERIAARLFRR